MAEHRRLRPSYANVVSTLALFVALGGSAYAASVVTGKDVRDGSLTGRDVRNGSLTSGDVRNGSLLAKDFKAAELSTGTRGPAGPQGATGAQGPAGPAGAAGLRAAFTSALASSGPAATGEHTVTATCPAGSVAVSGGWRVSPATVDVVVTTSSSSAPLGGPAEGWQVTAHEAGAAQTTAFSLFVGVGCGS